MPFDKNTAKQAGRKSSRKGIPNGSTEEMKGFLTALVTGQQSKIQTELGKLKGKDYLNAVIRIMEFVVPKQRQVEQIIDVSRLSDEEVDRLLDQALNRMSDEAE